ncbi:actin-related protein 5-like [Watersipora subatra]|uniref:actin-related protein 5-like n=1 Tax=Watersipora subatra TaxID=2589382 RepID=UPI00355BA260
MANIYNFGDNHRGKDPSNRAEHARSNAIVIENGSYECRAGFVSDKQPDLIFKNLAFRQKGRNNEADIVLVGREIENLETFRTQLKSPFDRNVVTQFDTQEVILDHVFSKLRIKSKNCVGHPVMISEPIANPNHSRKYLSELVFECYCVPSLFYYTDALGCWYHEKQSTNDENNALVVSIGYQTTHVIPISDGKTDHENIRRVNLGGYHLDYFMQKLLQLKYPIHAGSVSLSRAEDIVQNHVWIAEHYKEACDQWTDMSYYYDKVRKMQLPYGNVPANFAAVAMQGERQVERAKLTKEKQSLEKLQNKKQILDQLCEIQELTGTKLHRRLAELNVDSPGELQCHIKALRATVEDLKRKITLKEEFNSGILTAEWLQAQIDKLDNPDLTKEFSEFDVAEYYQLHIGIEQVRVPELLFQPSMVGIDQGGLSETLIYVLGKYPEEKQAQLSKNVLLTGGCACIPGIRERVEADLRSCRPFQSEIRVKLASDPVNASWKGARKWYNDANRAQFACTKAMYEELGGEYFIEHELSNAFYKTPAPTQAKPQ